MTIQTSPPSDLSNSLYRFSGRSGINDSGLSRIQTYLSNILILNGGRLEISLDEANLLGKLIQVLDSDATASTKAEAYEDAYKSALATMSQVANPVGHYHANDITTAIWQMANAVTTFKSPLLLAFWLESTFLSDRLSINGVTRQSYSEMRISEKWLDTGVVKLLRECMRDFKKEPSNVQTPHQWPWSSIDSAYQLNWRKVGLFALSVAAVGIAMIPTVILDQSDESADRLTL